MSLVPLDKIHPFDRVQVTRGDMVTVKRTLKLRRCVKMVTHELGEVVITAKALPVLEGPFLPRRGFSIILDRRDDKTWFWSAKSGC